MEERARKEMDEVIATMQAMKNISPAIAQASQLVVNAYAQGKKILVCGNGGSAAEAQHMAAEIVGRFEKERAPRPAIALSTDTSNLTAIGNDYGFDEVFARQVTALGTPGDVFIGISTSGNSPNVIKATHVARENNLKIILFLGKDGGKLKGQGDIDLIVPATRTSRIQEGHKLLTHVLCGILEDSFEK